MNRGSTRLAAQVLGATLLVTSLATATGSLAQHLAWPAFLAIAVAAWLGAPARAFPLARLREAVATTIHFTTRFVIN